MGIEFDPNELTAEQRKHIADFLINWPITLCHFNPEFFANKTDSAEDAILDKNGVAWNANIHSLSKSLNQDGGWKLKRGTKQEQKVPEPPKVPSIPEPPKPRESLSLTTIVKAISDAIISEKITQAHIGAALMKMGISEFSLLSSRPDLLPAFADEMRAAGVAI